MSRLQKLRNLYQFIKANHHLLPAHKKSYSRVENEFIHNLLKGKANFIEFERKNIKWRISLKDQGISKKIFSVGSYEEKSLSYISSFLEHFNLSSGFILDIGANIGIPSIPLAKNFEDLKILSFEPVLETYNILKSNIDLNKLSERVVPYNLGVGSAFEKLFINYSSDSLGTSEIILSTDYTEGNSEHIQVISLDQFLLKENIDESKINFAWVDIQGFEGELIKGGNKTLQNINIFMEIWPFGLERNKGDQIVMDYINENYHSFIPDDSFSNKYDLNHNIKISNFKTYYNNLKQNNNWASVLFIK